MRWRPRRPARGSHARCATRATRRSPAPPTCRSCRIRLRFSPRSPHFAPTLAMSADARREDPAALDTRAVRRAFSRAARSYDEAAVLQREVGARLASRLDVVKLVPAAILDAGC